jgi:tRNA threonylcarbamoyladenosine biosynthesis protein TsaB
VVFARLRAAVGRRFVAVALPTLRQLLAAHPVALLLDAASARTQVGLLTPDPREAQRWVSSDDEAGVALFAGAERLLAESGRRIADVGAFLCCEGPGSVLGIRTAAMALRTWRVLNPAPVFAYRSLDLVAHALGDPAASVIADARRDSWHVVRLGAPLRRVPTAELRGGLIMPEHFRNWTPLPEGVRRTPYDVPELLAALPDADLFRQTDEPDAFLHEEPSYVTWTPQVHQAEGRGPTASPGQAKTVPPQENPTHGRAARATP